MCIRFDRLMVHLPSVTLRSDVPWSDGSPIAGLATLAMFDHLISYVWQLYVTAASAM